jgi:AraC family transcriptional regulator
MKHFGDGVQKASNLYFYTASSQARKTFFYPLCMGHFYCDSTYRINRNSYDNFLIMYVKKGSGYVTYNSITHKLHENQILFLDCYQPHSYFTDTGWETLWLHFDGIAAREYYNLIVSNLTSIITLKDTLVFEKSLLKVYDIFHNKRIIKEALISKYITAILTDLLLSDSESSETSGHSDIIEETIIYINEHIREGLSLNTLASNASLSPYYFTRVFQKETGYTPHEYIIAVRINSAKFFFKTTLSSVKEIGINCGFTNESSFCNTFKKWVHMTPGEYRNTEKQNSAT